MADVAKDPKVISPTNKKSLKTELKEMLDQLERCQKALSEFLEEKRSVGKSVYPSVLDGSQMSFVFHGGHHRVIKKLFSISSKNKVGFPPVLFHRRR